MQGAFKQTVSLHFDRHNNIVPKVPLFRDLLIKKKKKDTTLLPVSLGPPGWEEEEEQDQGAVGSRSPTSPFVS